MIKASWITHAITVKGAPDLVLQLCTDYQTIDDQVRPLDDEMRARIRAANDNMTKDALRVMGFAYRIETKSRMSSAGNLPSKA